MNKVIKNSSPIIVLLSFLLIPLLAYDQGSRYTGSYKRLAPIELVNKSDIIIDAVEISNLNGICIALYNCHNVIIKNSKFGPTHLKPAIYVEGSSNITIIDCTFENVQIGLLASNCTGNIKFEYNDVKNIVGNLYGGSAFAQMVQFQRNYGAGNSISYNVCDNIPRESAPEDVINIFASNGTSESPIRIKENWLRGGGPSASGGGILLGDHGGSYQVAENNILVDPGQYGVAIGGGNNMIIRNNKIYGKRQSFTNVGLYAVNWTTNVSPSHSMTIENNEINFTNANGNLNNTWFDASVGTIKGRETNRYNSNLNESILPRVILNRAQNPGDNPPPVVTPPEDTPPVTPPEDNTPNSQIAQVYIDSFNRIAIKYFSSPASRAYAELFTSTEQLETLELTRFNTVFKIKLTKGTYYIRVTYSDSGKTETNKITIK
ncbi:MAG TPA: right-handed parallel beta-helix repeat-containing protein [Dysgonamonadaceae bacterium]|nr:right-handed parallel beta-helix repeat-containing protein [Dysgonamonadaceae bacterium]